MHAKIYQQIEFIKILGCMYFYIEEL